MVLKCWHVCFAERAVTSECGWHRKVGKLLMSISLFSPFPLHSTTVAWKYTEPHSRARRGKEGACGQVAQNGKGDGRGI